MSLTVDPNTNRINAAHFGYDAAANVTSMPNPMSGGAQTLGYDHESRVITVTNSSMDPLEIERKVKTLVSRQTGLPVDQIHNESRLLHDLGITGDDAEELLIALERECGVGVEGVPFDRFFTGEASLSDALRMLGLYKKPIFDGKQVLTVSDLIRMAEHRTWNCDRQ